MKREETIKQIWTQCDFPDCDYSHLGDLRPCEICRREFCIPHSKEWEVKIFGGGGKVTRYKLCITCAEDWSIGLAMKSPIEQAREYVAMLEAVEKKENGEER